MVDASGKLLLFPDIYDPGSYIAYRKNSGTTFVGFPLSPSAIEEAEGTIGTYEVENYVEGDDSTTFSVHGTNYVLDSNGTLDPADSGNYE